MTFPILYARFTIAVPYIKSLIRQICRIDEFSNIHSVFECCFRSKAITWLSWKERLLAERLTRKSSIVFKFLEEGNAHWEESFWWRLARNVGMKVNAEAFESMTRSISVNILAKHKNQIHQLEALLFGQAGLLNENFQEDYPQLLQREYNFLKKKYDLKPIHTQAHFLRMRPGNFPTIRLSQLAALIQNSAHLFQKFWKLKTCRRSKNYLMLLPTTTGTIITGLTRLLHLKRKQ